MPLQHEKPIQLTGLIALTKELETHKAQIHHNITVNLALIQSLNKESQYYLDTHLLTENIANSLDKKMALIDSTNYQVLLPNGHIENMTGLNLNKLKNIPVYSAEQIISLRHKAQQLLTVRSIDKRVIDTTFNQFTKQQFMMFINTFGQSQKYRVQNEVLYKQSLQDLEELFWTRSYIRSIYGRSLGSFGIHFTKRAFHIDLFANKNIEFKANFLRNTNELRQVQDLCYAAMQSQSNKAMQKLQLWAPMTSFISFSRDTYGYFAGESQLRQANIFVLSLIIADIEEELILGKKGGFKALRQNYQSRWYKDQPHKDFYSQLENRYLNEDNDQDIEADITEINSSTLKGVFLAAINALENQEDRTEEGKKILSTIDFYTKSNKEKQKRKLRRVFSK